MGSALFGSQRGIVVIVVAASQSRIVDYSPSLYGSFMYQVGRLQHSDGEIENPLEQSRVTVPLHTSVLGLWSTGDTYAGEPCRFRTSSILMAGRQVGRSSSLRIVSQHASSGGKLAFTFLVVFDSSFDFHMSGCGLVRLVSPAKSK